MENVANNTCKKCLYLLSINNFDLCYEAEGILHNK